MFKLSLNELIIFASGLSLPCSMFGKSLKDRQKQRSWCTDKSCQPPSGPKSLSQHQSQEFRTVPHLRCLEASSQAWVAFTSLPHNLGAASRMHSPKCCFRAPFSQIHRPSETRDLRNPLVHSSYFAKEMQGKLRPTKVTLLQRAN